MRLGARARARLRARLRACLYVRVGFVRFPYGHSRFRTLIVQSYLFLPCSTEAFIEFVSTCKDIASKVRVTLGLRLLLLSV